MYMAINTAGIVLIALIIWWFWLAKPKAKTIQQGGIIDVVAENGVYSPSLIQARKGVPLTLRFIRKDPNPCAEKVIFSDLNTSADLTLERPEEITLTVNEPGSYEFTCQMGMYRGKLLVQ